MFSDTLAAIAPSSALVFVLAQITGGVLAAGLPRALYPRITAGEQKSSPDRAMRLARR